MAHEYLIEKNVGGVKFTKFNPSPKMRLFALSIFCDPNLKGLSPHSVCESLGIGKGAYETFEKWNPWFEEWLEEIRITLGGKNKKALLESIGMERALAGDFQFWKPLAIREGVIDADRLSVGVEIPSSLKDMEKIDGDKLKGLENSLLAELRGESNPRPIDLVEGPEGWEHQGSTDGAPQVQGSLVLDPELGTDRERALSELESF